MSSHSSSTSSAAISAWWDHGRPPQLRVDKLDLSTRDAPADSEDIVSLHRPPGYWKLDSLRPGVTGYWQVMARSNVSYEERLRLDMTYVTSWSLKLDLQIVSPDAARAHWPQAPLDAG